LEKIRVVCYGLGAVGSLIAKFLLQKEGVQIVGAIDIDKYKDGKDLGEILGLNRKLGIFVSDDVGYAMSKAEFDVVVHATGSYLKDVYEHIASLAEYGADVISTCEELAYPYISELAHAKKLDDLSTKYGVTFLGTGVNPGFLMDTLVITLTGLCQKIDKIRVERVMNAATRRIPFQKKIGAGLTLNKFKEKMGSKEITGHVGLEQSISMIAAALRWELDEITVESPGPVIAEREVVSQEIKVKKGQVAGLRQTAPRDNGRKRIDSIRFSSPHRC
jgi:hypothetical protein